ncbi:TfoX/Sxy family protein [Anaerorhabdus furcosa]|uniref:DNA transformation protein n=1 Tax=Anaerorhabdus furcosa TaxID=118967 RepID=A0A1T4MVR8_9FIRM|nr:TfoX/Sxy family protein [Anaerorhabdus furcosa]SJZ70907.1 DNA transformation protein [Anaerorhabdus furcosa]
MGSLSKVVNIGKVLEQNLHDIGIDTIEELKQKGSQKAWLEIKKKVDPTACINQLYALEGAVQGIRWHDLDEKSKIECKDFFEIYK